MINVYIYEYIHQNCCWLMSSLLTNHLCDELLWLLWLNCLWPEWTGVAAASPGLVSRPPSTDRFTVDSVAQVSAHVQTHTRLRPATQGNVVREWVWCGSRLDP